MSVEKETRLKERFSKAGRLFIHVVQSKPHYWKLKSGPPVHRQVDRQMECQGVPSGPPVHRQVDRQT